MNAPARPDPRLVAECMRENRGRLLAAVSVVQAALATRPIPAEQKAA